MDHEQNDVVNITKKYYDSDDAMNFYVRLWGGEDLHLGIYHSPDEDIYKASRRTVEHMARKVNINRDTHVIDLGGGFGGSARYLAKTFGCKVTVVNLSEKENELGRTMNREQGLDGLITILDGNFEDVPVEDNLADIVWSQDAILHSAYKNKVVKEAARILKPGGDFVFTDPMMRDGLDDESVLKPILARIHLKQLGSPDIYKSLATQNGFELVDFENQQSNLTAHYSRVRAILAEKEEEVKGDISQEYIDNMKKGLDHWIDGGKKQYLTWGIFHFSLKS